MTASPVDELAELLAGTHCLLLDFDGPICAIFAGRPARTVVLGLLDVLAADGTPIPEAVANAKDPFDVLRHAGTISTELAQRVEAQLRANEIEAARSATPTPHTMEIITAWRDTGRPVAVVSNNSAAAVENYLSDHGINVEHVAARTSADPALLKPSPHLITQAIGALNAEPAVCALVGDSLTDMTAARLAGVHSVGYANKPGKHRTLSDAGAEIVIDEMQTLAQAVALTSLSQSARRNA
jgi:HAD superfamily hydrolase (TIGR01662 family)